MRTALVLVIPEAEPVVGEYRARHDPSAADGMPAHVTVLYPFRAVDLIDEACLARLGGLFREVPPFTIVFAATGQFPGVRWLDPQPRAHVDRLTEMTAKAFPDCPPYGGAIPDPVPHLTFAIGDETVVSDIERSVAARLTQPVRSHVRYCSLYAMSDNGWQEHTRFPFGSQP